jgi:hypothetical protein
MAITEAGTINQIAPNHIMAAYRNYAAALTEPSKATLQSQVPAGVDEGKIRGSSGASDSRVSEAQRVIWKNDIVKQLKKLEDAFPKSLECFEKYQNEKAQAYSQETGKKKLRKISVVRSEDFAKVMNCSRPTVEKLFRFSVPWEDIPGDVRKELVLEVAKEQSHEWPNLRSKQSPFAQHLLPRRKVLDAAYSD